MRTRGKKSESIGQWGWIRRRISVYFVLVFVLLATRNAAPAFAADCPDADGDGWVVCGSCTVPAGKNCGDCNDGNSAVHPDAAEICDGLDNDCDGTTDEDPDPIDGDDNDLDGEYDEGFGYCIFAVDGPADECKTGGRTACVGGAPVCQNNNPGGIVHYAVESLAAGTCFNGIDDDCDGLTDLDEVDDCREPEKCDGLDNDGDDSVDEGFPVGDTCEDGIGECLRTGVYSCAADGTAVCSASAGAPKNEGATFGNTCADGKDNNCDDRTDRDDPLCAGFGDPELCGNSIDDDGDGFVDEGFPTLGLSCATGTGACKVIGHFVCSADGTGTTCDAVAGAPGVEGESAGTCGDFIDNDCDGFTDAKDADCSSAYADLGVTCSLPYTQGKPGADCTGWHAVTFDGGEAESVKADLLAFGPDGSLLGIIENVNAGDAAHLASRLNPEALRITSKTNKQGTRHTVFAPMPLLRVTGTKGGVQDVAYCSIMPYLEVTQPDGVTLSLSEGEDLPVSALLPLVDVDTLEIRLNGVDILEALGIDPATAFPTNGSPLCGTPGECVFSIEAGCGSGAMVPVEIANLIVEGLDGSIVRNAKDGVEEPDQVNTMSFTVRGLPPGGHVFYVNGSPLRLPWRLTTQCLVDDLADAGTASAFGISIDSPQDQEVVATAPVHVQGTVCGGNEITSLRINGKSVDVSIPANQTCTTGDGVSSSDECVVEFDEPIEEMNLALAVEGTAPTGTFKRGSNRIIADAIDDRGNRTFNIDTVFGLGDVQAPAAETAMMLELGVESALDLAVAQVMNAVTTEIDPAFVVGLEESAVQDFFNQKCSAAIEQFTARATAAISNKTFGTLDIEPSCSCNLYDVPVVLESLIFTPSTADPTCAVDFESGEIGVRVNLPDIFIQVGAHKSCTDHGLFGECIARTKVNVTAVTKIEDISFDFTITEDQIENKTPPDTKTFTFAWTVLDNGDRPLFTSAGTCSGGSTPGRTCYGDTGCDGGTCVGVVENPDYNAVTQENSTIECWGAELCTAFQVVGAVLIEVFTLGFADGAEIVDFVDFNFEFEEDFLAELTASEPDAMELDEVEVDEETVAEAGHAAFTPGPIDVEIEDGGLTVAFGAEFTVQTDDPEIDETPGASITPARVPTVAEVIATGDEITMLIADDVFGQVFAAMKESGALQAFCTDLDGLTVGDLLPADVDGGCDSLGDSSTIAGVTVQGICHAIRDADCSTLTGNTLLLTNTKVGVCAGFKGEDCTTLPLGQRGICNLTPSKNVHATDGVLLCARQDMEPDLLIQEDDASDHTVDTDLLLNDLNIVFALDRSSDGYTGSLEALPGCLGPDGNDAPDCRIFAACLDLTLKTTMGIDSSQCAPNEAGFVFALNQVITSSFSPGVMCSAATDGDDQLVLGESFDSVVVDSVSNNSEAFTPPFCVEGLTLGGVLDFSSAEAKLFGLTTNGGTGFADFLGITVGLNPPEP